MWEWQSMIMGYLFSLCQSVQIVFVNLDSQARPGGNVDTAVSELDGLAPGMSRVVQRPENIHRKLIHMNVSASYRQVAHRGRANVPLKIRSEMATDAGVLGH